MPCGCRAATGAPASPQPSVVGAPASAGYPLSSPAAPSVAPMPSVQTLPGVIVTADAPTSRTLPLWLWLALAALAGYLAARGR